MNMKDLTIDLTLLRLCKSDLFWRCFSHECFRHYTVSAVLGSFLSHNFPTSRTHSYLKKPHYAVRPTSNSVAVLLLHACNKLLSSFIIYLLYTSMVSLQSKQHFGAQTTVRPNKLEQICGYGYFETELRIGTGTTNGHVGPYFGRLAPVRCALIHFRASANPVCLGPCCILSRGSGTQLPRPPAPPTIWWQKVIWAGVKKGTSILLYRGKALIQRACESGRSTTPHLLLLTYSLAHLTIGDKR